MLAHTVLFPGLVPEKAAGVAPDPTVTWEAATGRVVNPLLGWFFGFGIGVFQEDTLFPGFLRSLLLDRYGRLVAIVGRAVAFVLAHLGYYPVHTWRLLLVVFLVGLITGWLVDRRGLLLSADIVGGSVGERGGRWSDARAAGRYTQARRRRSRQSTVTCTSERATSGT